MSFISDLIDKARGTAKAIEVDVAQGVAGAEAKLVQLATLAPSVAKLSADSVKAASAATQVALDLQDLESQLSVILTSHVVPAVPPASPAKEGG